jgi:hypothetical protein
MAVAGHARTSERKLKSAAPSPRSALQPVAGLALGPTLLQRAQGDRASLTPGDVITLQRTVGNRAVQRLLSSPPVIQRNGDGVGEFFAPFEKRQERAERREAAKTEKDVPVGGFLAGIEKRTERAQQREAAKKTPEVSVGEFFAPFEKRQERGEKRREQEKEKALSPEQEAAASAFETGKGARQKEWDLQVAAESEWRKAAAEREAQASKEVKTELDEQATKTKSRETFKTKITAVMGDLKSAEDRLNPHKTTKTSAIGAAKGVSEDNKTYNAKVAKDMTDSYAKLDAIKLNPYVKSLTDAAAALTGAPTNENYRGALKALKGVPSDSLLGDVDKLSKTVEDNAKLLTDSAVTDFKVKRLQEEHDGANKLSAYRQGREENRIRSKAPGTIGSLTKFEGYLQDVINAQHNPDKSAWLEQMGIVPWGKLWGKRTVGSVSSYNVHASLYKDSIPTNVPVVQVLGNPAPATKATVKNTILNTGTGGFHVTMEVHGEYGTATKKNSHFYRGGPVHQNNYEHPTIPWATALGDFRTVRDSAVADVETKIDEFIDNKGASAKR